jgi:soluble lytic murein transglycosylase-like protein
MSSNSQIDAFNGIVTDYNSRCGSYRYRSGALERARRAIEPYRSIIIANAWDGVSLVRQSAPQQKPPVQRSQLTMDIQKALSELGYQPGTADGIYGQKTKSAIQSFQRDIGAPQDGLANSQLLERVQKELSRRRSGQRSSKQPRVTGPAPTDAERREILSVAANPGLSFSGQAEAEVWLTDMSRRLSEHVADPVERIELLKLIHMEAARVDLPPELILAVIEVESNFDPNAVSVDGELGLMQIEPYWLKEIGRPDDNLLNTSTNLRYGCTILRFYYDKENGDLRRALGRYDGSLGQRKYPNKVIDKLSKKWFQA